MFCQSFSHAVVDTTAIFVAIIYYVSQLLQIDIYAYPKIKACCHLPKDMITI